MIIYIGADHRGFYLKETLKNALKTDGYEVIDVGASESDANDDFPTFAEPVARKVSGAGDQVRGILICGSGVGVDVAANKFDGVRSALATSVDQVKAGRNDDDVNVLALSADFTKPADALEIARAFLATPFKPEARFERRLDEIKEIEKNN